MSNRFIQERPYLLIHQGSVCKGLFLANQGCALLLQLALQGIELLQLHAPPLGWLPQWGLLTKPISSNNAGVRLVGFGSAHAHLGEAPDHQRVYHANPETLAVQPQRKPEVIRASSFHDAVTSFGKGAGQSQQIRIIIAKLLYYLLTVLLKQAEVQVFFADIKTCINVYFCHSTSFKNQAEETALLPYQSYMQAQGLMNCSRLKAVGEEGIGISNGLTRPMTSNNLIPTSLFCLKLYCQHKVPTSILYIANIG